LRPKRVKHERSALAAKRRPKEAVLDPASPQSSNLAMGLKASCILTNADQSGSKEGAMRQWVGLFAAGLALALASAASAAALKVPLR
jgi:hypothetical protein